jgi:hypothetical protein
MKVIAKKNNSIYQSTAFFLLLILFMSSCSSARLSSSWSLPDATAHNYKKILVIGMTGAKDREIRGSIENAMVKKLSVHGINAQTATSKYGPRTFQNMSDDEATKLVKDDGFDGVIILALLDKNKEDYYTPGYIKHTPYAVVRSRWTSNYRVLYARVYTPGYYTTTTDYELEANFYDANTNELQYSAQISSFNPGSASALSADFSKTVIDDMIKKCMIIK